MPCFIFPTYFIPVVMIADLIAAGLQEGYEALNSATMPET